MNEDLENRADMNTGKKWSEMGPFGSRQLHQAERSGRGDRQLHVPVATQDPREKIAELERSGELAGLIEKAAAEAVDEPEDGETAT